MDRDGKTAFMKSAMKNQYLIVRNSGEQIVKALRVCNYSEWFNEGQNACLPCRSAYSGGAAYPMELNAKSCTECVDVKMGKLDDFYDSDALGRISYLCNNAASYKVVGSTQQS